MFCIKCGKEAFKDNLCEKCFLEKKELFKLKPVKIRYCPGCEKYYSQTEKISKDDMKKFLLGKMQAKEKIRDIKIDLILTTHKIDGNIAAKGFANPSKTLIEDKKKIMIFTKNIKCENCVKISGNYHEAVLQVRGTNKERIMGKAEKILKQDEIADVRALKEGYDILVVSKSSAIRAIKMLKHKCDIKQSFKLMGEKKGRKIYRNYYSIR